MPPSPEALAKRQDEREAENKLRAEIKAALTARRAQNRADAKAKKEEKKNRPPTERQLRLQAERLARKKAKHIFMADLKRAEKKAHAEEKRIIKQQKKVAKREAKRLCEQERMKTDPSYVPKDRKLKRAYDRKWQRKKRKKVKEKAKAAELALRLLNRQEFLQKMGKQAACRMLAKQSQRFSAGDRASGQVAGVFAAEQGAEWLRGFVLGYTLRTEQIIAQALDEDQRKEFDELRRKEILTK